MGKDDALAKRDSGTVQETKPSSERIIKTTPVEELELEIIRGIKEAGTLDLAAKQREALLKEVKDEEIEIRPDGLLYLPWVNYVERLREAFGPTGWAMVPRGMPKTTDKSIIWAFYLIINGKFAGVAVGEQNYYPNNPTMSYTDAVEGAKSNALMRLCKGIGIGLELWKPPFIRAWKEKYAETYTGKDNFGNEKTLWRKKGESKQAGESVDEGGAASQAPAINPESKSPGGKSYKIEKPKEEPVTPGPTEPKPRPEYPTASEAKEEKEKLIELIKRKLENQNIAVPKFKEFLFGFQTQGKRRLKLVDFNNFKKLSFHEGEIADLKKLLVYIDSAIDNFKKSMIAKSEETNDKNPQK